VKRTRTPWAPLPGWTRGLLGPLVVALALLLAACGGGGNDPPPPDQPGPFPVGVTAITFERTSSTTGEPRPLETAIWYPAADSAREMEPDSGLKGVVDAELTDEDLPLPLIIFSHGSGGAPAQSTFFTARLASYGFVVAAPPHPGNTLADCFPCQDMDGLVDSFLNRPDDISFVVDSLLDLNADEGSMFFGAIDPERIGMSGHSFGGLTTLFVVLRDDRFRAALPMAPAVLPFVTDAARELTVPTLIMGGGLDETTPIESQQELLDVISDVEGGPDYLLTLPRAGHLAFADPCVPTFPGCEEGDLPQERAHELIDLFATSFLMTYVALDDRYEEFLNPDTAAYDDAVLMRGD
jgi:predicted dienelactone hydrolase